jgi:phage recombination protein Bet
MKNELTSPNGALSSLASRLDIKPERMVEVLKSTAFKACKNDDQFAALIIVANTYGLNPLLKELYAFPGKGGEIVPIVSIDGWLRIINDHPQMDGMSDSWADDGSWCEVTIHRKDRTHPTVHREYLDEVKRNTEPWKQHPRRMLKWKTIIQTGRIAFGFGGIHDEDEGQDVGMRSVNQSSRVVLRDQPIIPVAIVSEDKPDQPDQVAEKEEETEPGQKERPAGKMIRVTFLEKSTKSGKKKDGNPFTRYGFKLSLGDGEFWAGTFSKTLGSCGFRDGEEVDVIVEKDGKNYELLWIEEVPKVEGELI